MDVLAYLVNRQTHNGEVVSLYTADEAAADALNGVAPSFVSKQRKRRGVGSFLCNKRNLQRFASLDIALDSFIVQRRHVNLGLFAEAAKF